MELEIKTVDRKDGIELIVGFSGGTVATFTVKKLAEMRRFRKTPEEDKFRQAASSKIITSAHLIREGKMPELRSAESGSDFYFVERDTPEEIAATLVKLTQNRISNHLNLNPIRDIQVLCPINRGSIGVRELNTALQSALNPVRPGEATAERFGWRFQVRDKVIQTENNYKKEVFNGDIGIIEKIDPVKHEVSIRFDERLVEYDYGELDEVSLAYMP